MTWPALEKGLRRHRASADEEFVTTPQQHVVIAIASLGLLDEIAALKRQIRLSRDAEQRADLESAVAKTAAQLDAYLPTEQPLPSVPIDDSVELPVSSVVDPSRSYRPRGERRRSS